MLIFHSSSSLLPSFFLPPTTKLHPTHKDHSSRHQQAGGAGDCWILGWEWRTRDADRLESFGKFFFFTIFSFRLTNFYYTYSISTPPAASGSSNHRRSSSTGSSCNCNNHRRSSSNNNCRNHRSSGSSRCVSSSLVRSSFFSFSFFFFLLTFITGKRL